MILMKEIVSSKGKTATVPVDFYDRVVTYEKAHEDWSIVLEMRRFGKTLRLSTLDLLASFVYDGGYKAWIADGFTVPQLTELIEEALNELGFSFGEDQSPE